MPRQHSLLALCLAALFAAAPTVAAPILGTPADAAGGSILGLMMLGAAKGDAIEIAVSGEGAEDALLKLAGLVKDGFGED